MATVDVVLAGFSRRKSFIYSIFLICIIAIGSSLPRSVSASETVLKVKGVAISKLSFYNSNKDFTCLDGTRTIPFHQVNDDYCDCVDGTDEPGTSACDNGRFYCLNTGYRPEYLFSSRVNDGICDCCDGSDETSGLANCSNTCNELGKVMREEAERLRKLQQEGYQLYLDFQKQGIEAKQHNQQQIKELTSQKQALQDAKDEAEKIKNEAETPETEAKDKFDKEWEGVKAQRDAEKEKKKTEDSFKDLDTNQDGQVTVEEMQQRSEFDSNSDGEVTVDEIKDYFEDRQAVNFDEYKEKIWDSIKSLYKKPEPEKPAPPEIPPVSRDSSDDNDDSIEKEEDQQPKDEDDDDDDDDQEVKEENTDTDDDQKPDYDEETKKLIEVADQARDTFKQAEDKLNEHNRQISEIQTTLSLDMGTNNEFYPLKGQCFEYTDREYTYKICPFDRATQSPKNGGHETNLGTWGVWSGPENNLYSQMKFQHGTGCWNGPDRSATVNIQCGLTNELFSASEPSRCEYAFDFKTPALCNTQGTPQTNSDHDEL